MENGSMCRATASRTFTHVRRSSVTAKIEMFELAIGINQTWEPNLLNFDADQLNQFTIERFGS